MSDIDTLFQLPLGEFTAARNALAGSWKKSGRRDEAEQIKQLLKPSVSAWAVNHLYWRHRKVFDRLMATGAELRKAQAAQLSGETVELRRPLQARRESLANLSRLASAALQEAQHAPTPEMMRRIMTTLEALAAYGDSPDAPRAGHLVADVDPPGFETLAALVPRVQTAGSTHDGPSTVIPFRQKPDSAPRRSTRANPREQAMDREAARHAAQEALRAAQRTLREARAAASQAEGLLKKAAGRVKAAETAKTEAEERLDRVAGELSAARTDARRVAATAEEAAQAVSDAERALERARDATANS